MSTVAETARKVQGGEITAESLVQASLARIEATKGLNAYISVLGEQALERARGIDKQVAAGGKPGPLAGIPVAIKDNITLAGSRTTCGSRILEGFQSPYDATATARLLAAGAVPVGKTNMDEFAMGSTSETSAFGAPKNPLDEGVIAGGSSGGSAVAVAAGTVAVALGSDTGGSIRQPAACCAVVGLKPTYGRVSRYGLVAYASSLDQIGPFSANVADSAYLLNVLCGWDSSDATSAQAPVPDFAASLGKGARGKVIGLPKECFGEGVAPEVREAVTSAIRSLEKDGAEVREISLPRIDSAIAAYYVIATAEASANLSRYDGVRYSRRSKDAKTLFDLYAKSRSEGFGFEVKKRILLGTYVLSSGFYDAYYMQAQKVRRLITDDFAKAFAAGVDVVATPTMPGLPQKLGQMYSDPMSIYLQDIYTVAINLAGLPAISLPVGRPVGASGKLKAGLQLIGKPFDEEGLLQVASAAEMLAS
ncbi:MAG TPA: Asp-tRNA(Asn)/Glu-tRNA(Gln) amidotransferase subunit GatA [Fibrobacteria bacterium]|nr:Asp-tRNA(Asn)/Glu-tRNA(Gln) amidotransferase subunit GatA [Fibrobacteria bacterium]